MKKISLFFIFLFPYIISLSCLAVTNDLDLIILQNPKLELKKAVKKGQLEKMVRIIRLMDQKKIDLQLFQDSSLVAKAEKREIKNNRNSKKFLFVKGFLWTGLIATALFPAGASKSKLGIFNLEELDAYPILLKGMFMTVFLLYVRLMNDGKALFKRDGRLVKLLVKKYHEKSLAN